MDKKKKSPQKIYRPSQFYRITHAVIFFVFGGFFTTLLIVAIISLPQIFTAPVFLVGLVLFFLYLLLSTVWYATEYVLNFAIIVTPDGLWFQGYGKRFYPWESLTRLAKNKYSSEWGLRAYRAKKIYRSRFGKLFLDAWLYDRFIPLERLVKVPRKWIFSRDIEKFKKTEFGQDLYRYAHHLFGEYDDRKPKNHIEKNHAIMEEQDIEQEAFFNEQAQTQK